MYPLHSDRSCGTSRWMSILHHSCAQGACNSSMPSHGNAKPAFMAPPYILHPNCSQGRNSNV
ncbi:hypothetical protein BC567DRAFT_232785 [Phyllosticta citribraziliensis]